MVADEAQNLGVTHLLCRLYLHPREANHIRGELRKLEIRAAKRTIKIHMFAIRSQPPSGQA
jgi:hypothetical protein